MMSPSSEQGSSSPTATKQLGPTWTPVPWKAVSIDDPFWTPHLQVNREQTLPLHHIVIPRTAELASQFEPDVLNGVVVIEGQALLEDATDWAGKLYRSQPASLQSGAITAIPYYAWDNRQPGEMRVWLREGGDLTLP
jgi:hypothetical protein